ncbi:MAG: hypothetical protein ACLF0G_16400 [Candidatus Brocadiia bacterium]
MRILQAAGLACALAVVAACPGRAASLAGLTPGKTTRAEVHRALGEPAEGKGTPTETFRPEGGDFERIVVRYGADEVVATARFAPAGKLSILKAEQLVEPQAAARPELSHALDESVRQGLTIHYDEDGAHFYVRQGQVAEIWLDVPGGEAPAPAQEPPSIPMMPPVPPRPAEPPQPPKDPLARVQVASPAVGGGQHPVFHGLAVGRATQAQALKTLGSPRFVARTGPGRIRCVHDGAPFGLHSVVAEYGPAGVLRSLDLRFEEPLGRSRAANALGLGKPDAIQQFGQATIASFEAAGIELSLLDDRVTNLRLLSPPEPEKAAAKPPEPKQPPQPEPEEAPEPQPEEPPQPKEPPEPQPEEPPQPKEPPEPEPQEPAEPEPEEPPAPPPVAPQGPALEVRRVWHEPDQEHGGFQGVMALAEIVARGLEGQQLSVTARLRHLTGQAVRAVPGAPAGYTDDRGRLAVAATAPVPADPVRWSPFRVFVPYSLIRLPRGVAHELILSVTAACGEKRVTREAGCTLELP